MKILCDLVFKDYRYIVVVGMYMPRPQSARNINPRRNPYFANSITDSLIAGALFFFTIKIFRGGEGHCRVRRSLVCESRVCQYIE